MFRGRNRKYLADALIWSLLLTMPFWLNAIGGYTQLGTRVVIIALAAMALNSCSAIRASSPSVTPPISVSASMAPASPSSTSFRARSPAWPLGC